jgi:hypothetical protein
VQKSGLSTSGSGIARILAGISCISKCGDKNTLRCGLNAICHMQRSGEPRLLGKNGRILCGDAWCLAAAAVIKGGGRCFTVCHSATSATWPTFLCGRIIGAVHHRVQLVYSGGDLGHVFMRSNAKLYVAERHSPRARARAHLRRRDPRGV